METVSFNNWIMAIVSLVILIVVPAAILFAIAITLKNRGFKISAYDPREIRNLQFVKLAVIILGVGCLSYAAVVVWVYTFVVRNPILAFGLGTALSSMLVFVQARIIKTMGIYWRNRA